MNKQEFIACLRARLAGLPESEVNARVEFYGEVIDDRVEEGATEAEAVAAIGSLDDVAREILSQLPLGLLFKEKVKPARVLRTWEILLLVLGAPLWVSLLIGSFAVVLAVAAGLLAVSISAWASAVSLVVCAAGGTLAGVGMTVFGGNKLSGICLLGAALVCAGASIFVFYLARAIDKGLLWLFKKSVLAVKCFLVKGGRKNA